MSACIRITVEYRLIISSTFFFLLWRWSSSFCLTTASLFLLFLFAGGCLVVVRKRKLYLYYLVIYYHLSTLCAGLMTDPPKFLICGNETVEELRFKSLRSLYLFGRFLLFDWYRFSSVNRDEFAIFMSSKVECCFVSHSRFSFSNLLEIWDKPFVNCIFMISQHSTKTHKNNKN